MELRLVWDDVKRKTNLARHGLDFADAAAVLESRYRLDLPVVRNREARMQSVSYVLDFLAVLTVVHTGRDDATRVISFRHAIDKEREGYDTWLENECDEP